ncbi:glycosyltransferase family 2 protein [Aliinostoc sp. HNIBRCY26]|uniref:glycosyltransferase family 2 protein n=1 Tax=Aliinostoc sp. HNIBRCY26 TaxID=3418997 RepID=UPI003D03D8DB
MPKVSVIIPAYNAMAFLPTTLESVLKQTFNDYEVIVINDGSSDGIIDWFTQVTDIRVKLISQENQGPAAARNHGINQAQGEYLAFLDADDIWAENKLEKQVNILDENPTVGLVYSWVGSIDSQGNIGNKVRKNNAEGRVWETIIEHNIIECGSNPMVRRICFEKVGVFDHRLAYAQDWEMWVRVASRYQFQVINETLVYYRSHPNNRSKNWKIMEQNYNLIFEKSFAHAPEYLSVEDLKTLENRIYGFANLRIAWKALQSGDYQQAADFRQKAVQRYPQLSSLRNYLVLGAAIILVRIFGIQGYNKIRDIIYNIIGKRVSSIAG